MSRFINNSFFSRPLILLSVLSVASTFAILSFPKLFPVFLIISILYAVGFAVFFIIKKNFVFAAVFSLLAVICPVCTYFSYSATELECASFTDSMNQKGIEEYSVCVSQCRTYNSYSVIDGEIISAGNNRTNKNYKCRLGYFSGEALEKGDIVSFTGKPQSSSEISKGSDFDTSLYLRSKNTFIYFPSVTVTSSSTGEKIKHFDVLEKTRAAIKNGIFRYIPQDFNFDTASVAYAMTVGDKEYLSDNIKDNFRSSGLSHILCVSGMHLSIVAGFLVFIMRTFTVHKKLRCVILILFIAFYVALTGFSPSCIRAGLLTVSAYISLLLGRKNDSLIGLFAILLMFCVISPYSVLDISTQLSFCSSMGIVILFLFIPPISDSAPLYKRMLHAILCSLLSSVAAVTFTLPVSAYHFGSVCTLSIFSTLAVSTACELLLILILFLIIFSTLLSFIPILSEFTGFLCHILCNYLNFIAEFFAGFRYSLVDASEILIFVIIFIASLLVLSVFLAIGKATPSFITTCCTILISASLLFTSLIFAICDDDKYKVSYYRKNQSDRQLSVKYGTGGHLIINADSSLCADIDKADFDKFDGNNHILILPDNCVDTQILADNLEIFDKKHGINKVFVPDTVKGKDLRQKLKNCGVQSVLIPDSFKVCNIKTELEYPCEDCFAMTIDDGETKSRIVFADSYSKEYFPEKYDVCAFFTRYTHNQFKPDTDIPPDTDLFFTRMSKDASVKDITNTFSQTDFYIKE